MSGQRAATATQLWLPQKALGPFGTLCTWSGWAQRETSLAGLFCQLAVAFGFPTYSGEKLSLESFLPLTLWEALHVPGFGAMRMWCSSTTLALGGRLRGENNCAPCTTALQSWRQTFSWEKYN